MLKKKILICVSFWFRPSCLPKMKELNQNILGKTLFTAKKGHLRLTKEHLANPERLVEVGSPYSEYVFHTFYLKWEKIFFDKASDPRMRYLSKIGPAMCCLSYFPITSSTNSPHKTELSAKVTRKENDLSDSQIDIHKNDKQLWA